MEAFSGNLKHTFLYFQWRDKLGITSPFPSPTPQHWARGWGLSEVAAPQNPVNEPLKDRTTQPGASPLHFCASVPLGTNVVCAKSPSMTRKDHQGTGKGKEGSA